MNRFSIWACRAMIAAALACGASALPAATATVEVDRIVAVVNSEAITALQLRDRRNHILRNLKKQNVQLPPEDVFERQVLEQLIMERAQLQLARNTAVQIDEAMLERAIGLIANNNRIPLNKMRATLAEEGVTWERFREDIRTELILNRLREREVDNKVTVSDAEITNFLRNHPDALSGTEYRVAHILLRIPEGADAGQLETLRRRAEKILARLRAGENFARVAADSSDAPDNIRGGEIGWRDRDRLPGLYADAMGKLEPGEISPPLRSASGLHIVKLLEKREGSDAQGAREVEQIHARHILLKTSEVLSDADARTKLLSLRESIVRGADFAELAKAHSADLSAARGGDLGWVNPGDTVPEFEKAMNALAPNAVSPPVRTPFGWHLIQVLERRTQDMSEERRRNAARAALRQRKAEEAYEDWLRQLRDSTYVEYRLETE
ncbi:MAG: peptidylprolyl isomerase [Azoarcus sp.]|nr:peptidylprolyl isomerase [Azoarcus sp.]